MRNIMALLRLEQSTRRLMSRMRGHHGVVITTGGYVSGAAALAAKRLCWPLVLHEQNSYPGLVTRQASRWAHTVCTTFEASHSYLNKNNCVLTGLPVRRNASPGMGWKRTFEPSEKRLPHVLVVGGSQGARALVESAGPVLLEMTAGTPPICTAVLQTGVKNREMMPGPDDQGALQVRAFIDDVAQAYNQADIVVCRAGASTLSEIALWQLPAILVPYPHAAADHQRHNAESFVRAGAALGLDENELTPQRLKETILELIQSPDRREAMAAAMQQLARPDALESILDCVAVAKGETQ